MATAKERIKEEYIDKFYEWLDDELHMEDIEYGRKYGYCKGKKLHTDCVTSIISFQKYIFSGRTEKGWVDAGYAKEDIWALAKEGFLSRWENFKERKTYYFITQNRAKEIYKELVG